MKLTRERLRSIISEVIAEAPRTGRKAKFSDLKAFGKMKAGEAKGTKAPDDVDDLEKMGSYDAPDPVSDLIELLQKADDILLEAQGMTEEQSGLKVHQRKVSAVENAVSAIIRKLKDDRGF